MESDFSTTLIVISQTEKSFVRDNCISHKIVCIFLNFQYMN